MIITVKILNNCMADRFHALQAWELCTRCQAFHCAGIFSALPLLCLGSAHCSAICEEMAASTEASLETSDGEAAERSQRLLEHPGYAHATRLLAWVPVVERAPLVEGAKEYPWNLFRGDPAEGAVGETLTLCEGSNTYKLSHVLVHSLLSEAIFAPGIAVGAARDAFAHLWGGQWRGDPAARQTKFGTKRSASGGVRVHYVQIGPKLVVALIVLPNTIRHATALVVARQDQVEVLKEFLRNALAEASIELTETKVDAFDKGKPEMEDPPKGKQAATAPATVKGVSALSADASNSGDLTGAAGAQVSAQAPAASGAGGDAAAVAAPFDPSQLRAAVAELRAGLADAKKETRALQAWKATAMADIKTLFKASQLSVVAQQHELAAGLFTRIS
jgi:hypothetical protein